MSDNTKIEWTDATANYVNGCDIVSPGCTNCYAMRSGGRNLPGHPSTGLTKPSKAGHVWTGEVRRNEKVLQQVLSWRRPRRIFWNAHGDLFHPAVPDEWIDAAFAVMALTPHHTHQVLTKRPERMREYMAGKSSNMSGHLARVLIDEYLIKNIDVGMEAINQDRWPVQSVGDIHDPGDVRMHNWPLPNVWLGTSVEDQTRADERIPHLLATPAAVRFISAEPLLGPVDLTKIQAERFCPEDYETDWKFSALDTGDYYYYDCGGGITDFGDGPYREHAIDWVIVGGESGPGARPMHPDWARSLRDQCAAAIVPFHFKQWGEWEVSLDRERDDPDWRANYNTDYIDRGKSKWLNLAGGCGFHGERFHVMRRVGKTRAGRLLDGVQHDGFPA